MNKVYSLDVLNYNFAVVVPVQLRFSDFDAYGHANNSAMQSFYDLGRAAYLAKVISPDFYTQPQSLLVVSYTTDFLRQVKFGLQVEVRVAVTRIGNKSLGMLMAIVDSDGNVCSVSESVMAGYDKRSESSTPILPEWRQRIQQIEHRQF